MENQNYTNWLEVDLNAIRNNVKQLILITKRPIMPVIKANAYGLGAVEVGKAAIQAGANWFGVARFEEAIELRRGGISKPILVLGYTPPAYVPEAISNDIRVAVYDLNIANLYNEQAKKKRGKLKVHLKIDSGMGRLGVFPEDGEQFIKNVEKLDGVQIEGIFTHFARADDPLLPTTDLQIECFSTLVTNLQKNGLRPPIVHAANSAGSIHFSSSYFDMVRAGAAIVGIHPNPPASMLPSEFKQAMTWKTRLISVKTMPPGSGIGYGHRYITSQNERIGVIAVGYGDGYHRTFGNKVILHGKFAPLVASVCMDQSLIQLDDIPEAQIGDEVILFGSQGDLSISPEELGKTWNTINYEVITGLTARVTRVYLNIQE